MKRIICILIFLVVVINAYSQDFDLIVLTNGDYIACHIDSVSDTHVYFEMRIWRKWIHTSINKSKIVDFKLQEINKKDVSFKRGTSYIINPDSILLNQINRNLAYGTLGISLFFFSNISYERIIKAREGKRINTLTSFRVGSGVVNGNTAFFIGTYNILAGNQNNFEVNLGAAYFGDIAIIVLNVGYRRQRPDGRFVFRTGVGIPEGIYLSFGRSF